MTRGEQAREDQAFGEAWRRAEALARESEYLTVTAWSNEAKWTARLDDHEGYLLIAFHKPSAREAITALADALDEART